MSNYDKQDLFAEIHFLDFQSMYLYSWNEQLESPGYTEKAFWSSHRLALKLKWSPSMAPVTPPNSAHGKFNFSSFLMDWIASLLV